MDLEKLFKLGEELPGGWNPDSEECVDQERRTLVPAVVRELKRSGKDSRAIRADVWDPSDRTLVLDVSSEGDLFQVQLVEALHSLLSRHGSEWRCLLTAGAKDRSLALCREAWAAAGVKGTWSREGRDRLDRALATLRRTCSHLRTEVRAAQVETRRILEETLARFEQSDPGLGIHWLCAIRYEKGDPEVRLEGSEHFYDDPSSRSFWFVCLSDDIGTAAGMIERLRIKERWARGGDETGAETDVFRYTTRSRIEAGDLFDCDEDRSGLGILFRVIPSRRAVALDISLGRKQLMSVIVGDGKFERVV